MTNVIDFNAGPTLAEPIQPHDHVIGPEDALVDVVIYGDFECPHCRSGHTGIENTRAELRDQFRMAWRHFPQPGHPHAHMLSEAVEAAAAQGRFWDMREALWRNYGAFEREDLVRYAAKLGLDVARFEDDLDSHRHAQRIAHDVETAIASGANGTPTYFVNGIRYEGNEILDKAFFARRIRQAVERAG